jgi:5-methyltetrahydrofolate--homocysteine methyltransferase
MLIVGENLNATNKSVKEAIRNRDVSLIQKLASSQVDAGADYVDINAGVGRGSSQEEIADMIWLIDAVQAIVDKPLAIDSSDPEVIQAGLKRYKGDAPIINSITGEEGKIETLAPLVAERNAKLIALAMDEKGIPSEVGGRVEICDKILDKLSQYSISPENLFFDPLVLPIGAGITPEITTLKTLEQVKSRYPEVKTILGLSNISHGLPSRSLINRGFLLMAMYAGLDSVILNPLDGKLIGQIKLGNMLLGKDPLCKDYLKAYRKGLIKE